MGGPNSSVRGDRRLRSLHVGELPLQHGATSPERVHSVDPGRQLRPVGLLCRTDTAVSTAAEACRSVLAAWTAGTDLPGPAGTHEDPRRER